MAKERKSAFSTSTPKAEIEKQSKQIEKKVLGDKKAEKPKRPKHIYVDAEHHQQVKINASIMGMKLSEYVEWLIDQHRPSR